MNMISQYFLINISLQDKTFFTAGQYWVTVGITVITAAIRAAKLKLGANRFNQISLNGFVMSPNVDQLFKAGLMARLEQKHQT